MKFKFLDGLRGIAAVYVMIGHARWLLWEGFQDGFKNHPNNYSMIDKSLMYFFQYLNSAMRLFYFSLFYLDLLFILALLRNL